jgi:secreted trypsin-like serine protease
MRSNAVPAGTCAALLLLAACGGGGGSPSTPGSPSPLPTIPVSSACTALGQSVSSSTAIVNGVECSTANSPVVLLNMKDSSGQQAGSCSGTVIAPRAILTAAHCLAAATASIKVFLGTGPELVAQSFAAHPSWREANNTAFDAAVVLMAQDIGRPPAPLLLSRDARVGENAIVAGWGKDSIAGVTSTLRAGVVTITAVSSLTLQTTFTSTASSVCQGDSGGPILLSEGSVWSIGGVISANSTLACSFGDNFYANIRNPDISGFVLGRVPDASRR